MNAELTTTSVISLVFMMPEDFVAPRRSRPESLAVVSSDHDEAL